MRIGKGGEGNYGLEKEKGKKGMRIGREGVDLWIGKRKGKADYRLERGR